MADCFLFALHRSTLDERPWRDCDCMAAADICAEDILEEVMHVSETFHPGQQEEAIYIPSWGKIWVSLPNCGEAPEIRELYLQEFRSCLSITSERSHQILTGRCRMDQCCYVDTSKKLCCDCAAFPLLKQDVCRSAALLELFHCSRNPIHCLCPESS